MTPILMSIRGEWADADLDGSKPWEYRKRPIPSGTTVIVYRSGAAERRGIVGLFVAGKVVCGSPADHFREVESPGIGLDQLWSYAGEGAAGLAYPDHEGGAVP